MEGILVVGALVWLIAGADVKLKLQGGLSVGVDPNTKLPISNAGGTPGASTARQGQTQGLPVSANTGIMPPLSRDPIQSPPHPMSEAGNVTPDIFVTPDVVGSWRMMYGRGYGNKIGGGATPPIISKYVPYADDKMNSASDNNGGYAIGSGYR